MHVGGVGDLPGRACGLRAERGDGGGRGVDVLDGGGAQAQVRPSGARVRDIGEVVRTLKGADDASVVPGCHSPGGGADVLRGRGPESQGGSRPGGGTRRGAALGEWERVCEVGGRDLGVLVGSAEVSADLHAGPGARGLPCAVPGQEQVFHAGRRLDRCSVDGQAARERVGFGPGVRRRQDAVQGGDRGARHDWCQGVQIDWRPSRLWDLHGVGVRDPVDPGRDDQRPATRGQTSVVRVRDPGDREGPADELRVHGRGSDDDVACGIDQGHVGCDLNGAGQRHASDVRERSDEGEGGDVLRKGHGSPLGASQGHVVRAGTTRAAGVRRDPTVRPARKADRHRGVGCQRRRNRRLPLENR